MLDQQQVLLWLQTQGRAQCGLGMAILLTLLYLSPPGGPTAASYPSPYYLLYWLAIFITWIGFKSCNASLNNTGALVEPNP